MKGTFILDWVRCDQESCNIRSTVEALHCQHGRCQSIFLYEFDSEILGGTEVDRTFRRIEAQPL